MSSNVLTCTTVVPELHCPLRVVREEPSRWFYMCPKCAYLHLEIFFSNAIVSAIMDPFSAEGGEHICVGNTETAITLMTHQSYSTSIMPFTKDSIRP